MSAEDRRPQGSPLTEGSGASAAGAGQTPRSPSPDLLAAARAVFEHAFGTSIGEIFLICMPFAVLALGCVLFIREVPLRHTNLPDVPLTSDAELAGRRG